MKHFVYWLFLGLFSSMHIACSDDDDVIINTMEIAEEDKELGFLAEGTSRYINIKTNASHLELESDAEWLMVDFDAENKRLHFTVEDNASLDIRSANVAVRHKELQETIVVSQMAVTPAVSVQNKNLSIDFKAQEVKVRVLANVGLEVRSGSDWIVYNPELKSVSIDPVLHEFILRVGLLQEENEREGVVYFSQTGGALKDSVVISQQILASEDYEPGETSTFERDLKIGVVSASLSPADKYQSNQNIDKTVDGDVNTLYHSPWAGMPEKPVISLEYQLDAAASVANYIVLYPRASGANGVIKSGSIWVKTEDDATAVKVQDFELPNSNNPQVIQLNQPALQPRTIRIDVTDAYTHDAGKYYVSLAEFEIYESRSLNALEDDAKYFTDATFSELQPGLTLADISGIQNDFIKNMALFMLAEKYDGEFRVQYYEPFRPVWDLANELKTSAYSQFENPTGMFFKPDEEIVAFVGETQGEDIMLRVKDFGPSGDDHSYVLREGVNVLTMKGKGNGYVSYYTANYQQAPNVKIHIASGLVNGYFDITRHSDADGKDLLDNAVSEIMDIKGERMQLAYSVNSLKANAHERLAELAMLYDSIVRNQQTLMGLRKYNRLPKNRMLGRVIWSGFMHADGWGAAFHDNTMNSIANPDRLRQSSWGPAHEFGHVNQTRPGLTWVGTTEVTNNIFSKWIQFHFTPHSMRLEHENVNGAIGGRYNRYFTDAFINNYEWGLQGGAYAPNAEDVWGGDVFVSLIPMWQLHLFFHVAGEGNTWHRPYFYADVFERVRLTDESSIPHGQLQINFVKNVCDAVQMNLVDFFTEIGMLVEVDKVFGDYTNRRKTITRAMIDEVVAHISSYPKPELNSTLKYISVNSYEAFKYRRPVEGSYNGGLMQQTNSIRVQHSVWKNGIAYETFNGDELTNITLVGTGSADNTFSIVPYFSTSTRIEAVAFDGARTLVYGSR